MISWGAGGQCCDARGVESYTKSATSGVGGRVQIALGGDDADQASQGSHPENEVRVGIAGICKGGNTGSHQSPGNCAQENAASLTTTVVEALDQEPVARNHPENSPGR